MHAPGQGPEDGAAASTPAATSGPATRRAQLRAPHVAEIVADELRRRILDGEIPDGELLPKQEDLHAEFQVSRPSLREALRILEAEGLVSVRRGKLGGAVVHRPQAANAAYSLGLILRSRGVGVDDVSDALRYIEPVCAALCAARADRATEVVPRLREVQDAATACLDDPPEFIVVSRQFHEVLVDCCGNDTLKLVVGTLESLWSAQAMEWAERSLPAGFPDDAYRKHGLDDHAELLALIEAGDVDGVMRAAREHLEWAPVYSIDEENQIAPGVLRRERPR